MLSLYEILKASKTGIAPDMWTALAGANFGGAGSGAEVKELTGIPPLSLTADGTPLLDYLISGNMEQSGTPTHTSPIQPQETGDRTGNLFDKDSNTINNNGQIRPGVDVPAGIYSISNGTPNWVYYRVGVQGTTRQISAGSNAENINASDTLYVWRDANIRQDGVMLNTGSTALPYEPWGIKMSISSANTTTPVYLGEVQTTRKVQKLVLTGGDDENWSSTTIGTDDYIYRMELSDLPKSGVAPICTHYTGSTATRWVGIANYEVTTSIINSVAIRHSGLTGVSDWKSYLQQQYTAGRPVTVWYVLAEPETGIVNEPIRKIGDYADTVSMEQAGVQIPTNSGNTVIDVMTELKPSEMYIKYKG